MLSGLLSGVFGFVVAIGILVAFHEYGHYWVAKRLGVKVLRYSIGFGKPLLTWRRGADRTEYCLSAIPLGGYVRMLDGREDDVPPAEAHRAFDQQALWKRSAIVAAGPGANFLLAIVIYWALFSLGTSELKPVVGSVVDASPAAEAGLVTGDQLVAIDGRPTHTWDRVLMNLIDASVAAEPAELTVLGADGLERRYRLDLSSLGRLGDQPDLLGEVGIRPWRPALPADVGALVPGGAAEEAGMRVGDRILAVDGVPIDGWSELVTVLPARVGQTVPLSLLRDGSVQRVSVSLADPAAGRGILGINPAVPSDAYADMRHTVRLGPLEGLVQASADTWQTGILTLTVLWKMLVGEASLNNLSGPISIGQFAGDSASSGVVPFLKFLALISISLGLLNLLPIPMLDGGHLMYFAYEAATGSPPSLRVQLLGQQIGLFMLLSLMGLAFYNDLARLFG